MVMLWYRYLVQTKHVVSEVAAWTSWKGRRAAGSVGYTVVSKMLLEEQRAAGKAIKLESPHSAAVNGSYTR